MSLFKDVLKEDLENVFLNIDEFASLHYINGKQIICIVDDVDAIQKTRDIKAGSISNVTGLGLLHCDRVVCCKVEDLERVFSPGERIRMDSKQWIVDDNVSVQHGLLVLPLKRTY